jgi:hypothetical protein
MHQSPGDIRAIAQFQVRTRPPIFFGGGPPLGLGPARRTEKGEKIGAVSDGLAFTEDLTGPDVQRREQVRGAVPDVVMRTLLAGVEPSGSIGWVRSLGSALRLLVHRENNCPTGRISRHRPTTSATFSANSGSR